jgi:L-cysteate sulfo-lyase
MDLLHQQRGQQFYRQSRLHLAFLPTPLERAEALSKQTGVEIWIKRDDQTGLALGENKARKLEYLLADALAQKADTVITVGGAQSNHARMTAAACRKLGLECYLILDQGLHPSNGNVLLDRLLGAHIEFVSGEDTATRPLTQVQKRVASLTEELRSTGRQVYLIPSGGSNVIGALGYVDAMFELVEQCKQYSLRPDFLYLSTGSGGTQAGLLAALALLELDWVIQGISADAAQPSIEKLVYELANQTLMHLGSERRVERRAVHVDDRFIGAGYGQPTPALWDAIHRSTRSEGLLLDPVYTGNAMAGLFGHIQEGRPPQGAKVIFIHTVGTPALFAYHP